MTCGKEQERETEKQEEKAERASKQHYWGSRILGSWRYQGLRQGVEESSGTRRKQMPLRIRLPSCVMYTKGKKLFVARQECGCGGRPVTEPCMACRERQHGGTVDQHGRVTDTGKMGDRF